jgi:hypothetical protein
MPVYAWVCLGVFGGLVLPTSLAALVATIQLFRGLKGAVPDLEEGFDRLADASEALAVRTERAAAAMARVEAAARALNASRGELQVLLWALEDVRRVLRVVRAVVPRA